MNVDRRWFWAGGILAVAGVALAYGVPLATLLTLAAVLACPAAMYLGMGMMGRMQGGAETGGTAQALDDRRGATVAPSDAGDPTVILKRRLAVGEVTVEEYERLLAVLSRPDPQRDTSPAGQGASR